MVALGIAAILYGVGMLWNFFILPHPAADVPASMSRPMNDTRTSGAR